MFLILSLIYKLIIEHWFFLLFLNIFNYLFQLIEKIGRQTMRRFLLELTNDDILYFVLHFCAKQCGRYAFGRWRLHIFHYPPLDVFYSFFNIRYYKKCWIGSQTFDMSSHLRKLHVFFLYILPIVWSSPYQYSKKLVALFLVLKANLHLAQLSNHFNAAYEIVM